MKKPFGILTICLAALGLCAAPGEVEMKESVPFTARGGLPNFAAKLKAGEPVTVAYFGGSITEQNGWRVQSADFLRGLYPKSKISPVNAAIGGTGSDLGAFRLAHDVLEHKPDLVFVEFAVNDHGAKPDRIRKAMEGPAGVRHLLRLHRHQSEPQRLPGGQPPRLRLDHGGNRRVLQVPHRQPLL